MMGGELRTSTFIISVVNGNQNANCKTEEPERDGRHFARLQPPSEGFGVLVWGLILFSNLFIIKWVVRTDR